MHILENKLTELSRVYLYTSVDKKARRMSKFQRSKNVANSSIATINALNNLCIYGSLHHPIRYHSVSIYFCSLSRNYILLFVVSTILTTNSSFNQGVSNII